jgi:hypothetical protein
MNPFVRLALGFLALATAIKRILEFVSDKIFSVFVGIVDAVKNVALSIINKVRAWIGLAPIGDGGGGDGHGTSGSWEDSSGSVQRQSLMGPSQAASANFRKASYHPSAVNPFGRYSAAGSVNNVPSFGTGAPGGPADMSIGQGLAGSQFVAAHRARLGKEMQDDPALKEQVAGMMMLEGANDPLPVVESLMNRADMTGGTLKSHLFNGFYGPINRGQLPGAIAKLRANPKLKARMYAAIDKAIGGSHVIGGYTDQGLPTDPNGSLRGGRGHEMMKRGGNEYTDWAGGRGGRRASEAYRRRFEQGISGENAVRSVPPATDAVKNVPSPPSMLMMPNGSATRRGPVEIHINGGNHNPEALANLVQRRIDEQMNSRTHDTVSEYT